jgi:hypothetical protein
MVGIQPISSPRLRHLPFRLIEKECAERGVTVAGKANSLIYLLVGVLAFPVVIAGLLSLVWLYFYGPAHLRMLNGPPEGAFPGSVGDIDAKGVLSWWGCVRLSSGDAREVGSYDSRAILFIPGESCGRSPALPQTSDHLFVTWRATATGAPFGELRLVVPETCPQSISLNAREEAARLIQDFLDDPHTPARYRADAEAALAAVHRLGGPTYTLPGATGDYPERFHGGPVWGPARRSGAYLVCVPSRPPPQ